LEAFMAEQRRSGKKQAVPHHPLVEALASDPNQPPEKATKLFGYPGPAADKDATRLFLDTDLSSYVDVPNEAILHSQTLPDDQGTYLWVDPKAKLTFSSTQSHEVQADFLGGPIATANLANAAPVTGTAQFTTVATACRPSLGFTCTAIDCPTHLLGCHIVSAPTRCPTVAPLCPILSAPTHCPTVAPLCPELVSAATRCPTVPPLCGPVSRFGCESRDVICNVTAVCPSRATPCLSAAACPSVAGCPSIACTDPVGPFSPVAE
jgi:hypothetical protein